MGLYLSWAILIVQLESLTQLSPMIDKLSIVLNEIDVFAVKNAFGASIECRPLDKHYGLVQAFSDVSKGHLFTAYSRPKNRIVTNFKIELNPSKLGLNLNQLIQMLDFGMDVDKAKIMRIDHAVDFEIPVLTAFETVRVKHKRTVKGFTQFTDYLNGQLTGFYIGKVNQLAVYDKKLERRWKEVEFCLPHTSESPSTRFEMRHFKGSSEFKKIHDLRFLSDYDPFSKIEVLELKQMGDGFEAFKMKNSSQGFHNSYMNLNRQNNFRRDTLRYFDVSDLPKKLASIYREKITEKFLSP
jgi:hypothetical protein